MGRQQAGSMPADAVRILKDETINMLRWSNTAATILGKFDIDYDNGGITEHVEINGTIATTDRTPGLEETPWRASADGYITRSTVMFLSGSAARGQLFVMAFVHRGGSAGTATRGLISQGYLFLGHVIPIGENTSPGPGGGHGQTRELFSADPAANAEIAVQTVPSGAIWQLRSLSVVLVQGITQTPLPTLRIRNSGASTIAQIPITTVAIGASSTSQLTWGLGLVQSSFTAVIGDEFHTAPIPSIYLPTGSDFSTVTDGIGANTNYGAAFYDVEEWVMPN